MLTFATRSLMRERLRLAISVGGVAFAVVLIVLLRGLFVAYEHKVSGYFERIPAQLWVVQRGTADFFHSYSIVDDRERARVGAMPGVEAVHPYLARQVGFELRGAPRLLYVVGFDPGDPVTGPQRIVRGSTNVGRDGIVVDEVFATTNGVELGDRLALNGRDLRVTGISAGGDMVMFQYAYVRTRTARRLLSMPAVDNALLVRLSPGADVGATARAIEGLSPTLVTRDTAAMVMVNQRVITDSFLPVIRVLLVIGFAVGVAVIGLTIYSAVLEKRREYGVLKAVGARTRHLVVAVATQSLLAAGAGYLVGVGLAFGAKRAAGRWVPAFVTEITAADLGWVALATVAMAGAAALIPLSRVGRIDPAEVFRS